MSIILSKVRRSFSDIQCHRAHQLQQHNTKTSTPSQTTGQRRIERYDRILQVEALNGRFLFETE